MAVHIVADAASKAPDLRAALQQQYPVTSQLLRGASIRCGGSDAVIVTADLRNVDTRSC